VVRNPQTVEASDHLPLTADCIYNPIRPRRGDQGCTGDR
jgi:hypothetical protein